LIVSLYYGKYAIIDKSGIIDNYPILGKIAKPVKNLKVLHIGLIVDLGQYYPLQKWGLLQGGVVRGA
jgi:hypothetical protein